MKLNKENVKAILNLKQPETQKQLKSFFGAIQYMAKFLPRLSERTGSTERIYNRYRITKINNADG